MKVDPEIIVQNLFQIVDALVKAIDNDNAREIIQSFEIIASVITPIYPKFDSFLLSYASQFALRDIKPDKSKPIHELLFIHWKKEIKYQTKYSKSASKRFDLYLADFFFLLIIKSLILTKEKKIKVAFKKFTNSWCKSVIPLSQSGLILAKKAGKSFTVFLDLLSDIGDRKSVV